MKAPEVLRILSDKCRVKRLSYATEKSYRAWAVSYIGAVGKLPKAWPSEKKAEAFLTGLLVRDVVAAERSDTSVVTGPDRPMRHGRPAERSLSPGSAFFYRRLCFFPLAIICLSAQMTPAEGRGSEGEGRTSVPSLEERAG